MSVSVKISKYEIQKTFFMSLIDRENGTSVIPTQ